MSRFPTITVAAAAVVLGIATSWILAACSGSTESDDTGSQTEPLARNGDVDSGQFQLRNGTVHVCWEKNSQPGIAEQKTWIRNAIEKSWMNVTNVKFDNFGTCPADSGTDSGDSGTDNLYVTIYGSNGIGSACSLGGDPRALPELLPDGGKLPMLLPDGGLLPCPGPVDQNGNPLYPHACPACGMGLGSSDRSATEYIAAHEFGHVMGYNHEQDEDGGFTDPLYNPTNGGACPPTGHYDPSTDAWVPHFSNFNQYLVTPYDLDSIMNYCHSAREYSGRLSQLDIFGVQKTSEYGVPVRPDMDGDGISDSFDNCPFAHNSGDQLNSNKDAEILVDQRKIFTNCSDSAQDGHTPTGLDPQCYIDHWHQYYPGDACDPIAVTATANTKIASIVEKACPSCAIVGCTDLPGGTVNNAESCAVTLNTQLNFDGHIGGPAGMAIPTGANGTNVGAPTFCKCADGSALACSQDMLAKCFVATDADYPYLWNAPTTGWKIIQHEVHGTPNYTATFPELQFGHVDPLPGYDANSVTETWDFIADLGTFGMSGGNNLTGIGWTHEHNFSYSILTRPSETDLQNNYWPLTAIWTANAYHLPPNAAYLWQPIPYCNPGPKQENEHEIQYMTTVNSSGHIASIGLSGSTMFDMTPGLTANGTALLTTLTSGNELLMASDRIGGQPSDSTGYNALVLNAGTPKVVGAVQDSGAKMDGVFASTVVGTGQASLKAFSAINQALYWLSYSSGWQLNTRLVSNALAGNASMTTVTLSGTALTSPKGIAYNRATNLLFVADWVASGDGHAIRLLSVALSTGVVSTVWTTAAFYDTPAVYLSATNGGEAIVSVSSTQTGNIDVLMINAQGRPVGSYTATGALLSAVLGTGDGITIPLSVTSTETTPNLLLTYVKRSSLKYGACNSKLFLSIATSVLGSGMLADGADCNESGNGGFESGQFSATGSFFGTDGTVAMGTTWATLGASETISTTAHSGSYSALLGSTSPTNGDSTIKQTFPVPAIGGTLRFWYNDTCPDSLTYDWFVAQLQTTTGTTVATIVPKRCDNPTSGWTQVNFDLTPYAGQTLVFVATSHDDNYGADPTYTLVDDLTID